MKKILVVLSLICFVAVNVTNAQTAAPVAKKETATSTSATPACSHATKACCKKGGAKACTGDKAKSEATATPKADAKTSVKN